MPGIFSGAPSADVSSTLAEVFLLCLFILNHPLHGGLFVVHFGTSPPLSSLADGSNGFTRLRVMFRFASLEGIERGCSTIHAQRSGYCTAHRGLRNVGSANGSGEESVIFQTAASELQ